MNLGDLNGMTPAGRVFRTLPSGVGHGSSRPAGSKDEIAYSVGDGVVRWDVTERSWRSLNLASINTGARQTYLAKWRVGLGSVMQGLGDCKLLCEGDSTTVGVGSTGPSRTRSWPKILVDLFNGAGIPATYANVFGNPTGGATDSRLVLGTGWSASDAGPIFGFRGTVGAAGFLSFTPAEQFDRITIYYAPTGVYSTGTSSVDVDGGASLGTFSTNGSGGWTSVTFNCTLGTHTVNISAPATGSNWVRIGGIDCWRSGLSQVRVYNCGNSGAVGTGAWDSMLSGTTSTDDYGRTAFWKAAATQPHCTIVAYGINDANNGYSPSAFADSFKRAIATTYNYNGNSVLAVSPPQTSTAYQMSVDNWWAPFRSAIWEQGVPTVDLMDRWGHGVAAAAGGYLADEIHPSNAGYVDWARAVFKALTL